MSRTDTPYIDEFSFEAEEAIAEGKKAKLSGKDYLLMLATAAGLALLVFLGTTFIVG